MFTVRTPGTLPKECVCVSDTENRYILLSFFFFKIWTPTWEPEWCFINSVLTHDRIEDRIRIMFSLFVSYSFSINQNNDSAQTATLFGALHTLSQNPIWESIYFKIWCCCDNQHHHHHHHLHKQHRHHCTRWSVVTTTTNNKNMTFRNCYYKLVTRWRR